jgi:hypothetical protein
MKYVCRAAWVIYMAVTWPLYALSTILYLPAQQWRRWDANRERRKVDRQLLQVVKQASVSDIRAAQAYLKMVGAPPLKRRQRQRARS